MSKLYYNTINGFIDENRKKLKKANRKVEEFNKGIKKIKDDLFSTIVQLNEDDTETGYSYVQVLDYLREISNCLTHISRLIYSHVDNNRPPLIPMQMKELKVLNAHISEFYISVLQKLKDQDYNNLRDISKKQHKLIKEIKQLNKNQIKMIRKEEIGTRVSILYLNTLAESKSLLIFTSSLIKAIKDFSNVYAFRRVPPE